MANPALSSHTYAFTAPGIGAVDLAVAQGGEGRPFLLLHGGGGPATVAGFAGLLAGTEAARVVQPTHPGFAGTARPTGLSSIAGLAAVYVALLDELDLDEVILVGNSIGGWIAAEMALLHSPRVSALVVVDAVGIVVDGHPIADFFALSWPQLSQLSYHDPDTFGVDPSALPPAARAAIPGNRASLATYAGSSMSDPGLGSRLSGIDVPTLVVWGEADRIADVDYGRAFADGIPTARFQLLERTGHLPQVETPQRLLETLLSFAGSLQGRGGAVPS